MVKLFEKQLYSSRNSKIESLVPMFKVHIIKSETTHKYYTGQTANLVDRFKRHSNNQVKSTANQGPWHLVFDREFTSRSEAVEMEKKIKKRGAKRFLESLEH